LIYRQRFKGFSKNGDAMIGQTGEIAPADKSTCDARRDGDRTVSR
jgi:thymidine phosphorylase